MTRRAAKPPGRDAKGRLHVQRKVGPNRRRDKRTSGEADVIPLPKRTQEGDAKRASLIAAGAAIRKLAIATRETGAEILEQLVLPSREETILIEHAWEVIDDMFVLMAEMCERQLTDQELGAVRDYIQHCYLRRFLLDPDSERHARLVLLSLIQGAVTRTLPAGPPKGKVPPPNWALATIEGWVDWILERYREDFPVYAAKLAQPERRSVLRATVAGWSMVEEGDTPPMSKWKLLEKLGKGVFATTSAKDWKNNVWATGMRSLVWDDEEQ
jgi:hypothetical protein